MRWFKKPEEPISAPESEPNIDYFYQLQCHLSEIKSSYYLSVKHCEGYTLYMHSPCLATEVGIYDKGSYKRLHTYHGGDVQNVCQWTLEFIKQAQQRAVDLMTIEKFGDDWVHHKPDTNTNSFVIKDTSTCINFAQVIPDKAEPNKTKKKKTKSKRKKK